MVHVEEQLERMVAALEQLVPNQRPAVSWTPRTVAWRNDDGVALAVNLPGIARDKDQHSVNRQVITVSVQRHIVDARTPRAHRRQVDPAFGTFAAIVRVHVTARTGARKFGASIRAC